MRKLLKVAMFAAALAGAAWLGWSSAWAEVEDAQTTYAGPAAPGP